MSRKTTMAHNQLVEKKQQILHNIKKGHYKLIRDPNRRSDAWKIFSIVARQDGTVVGDGYVFCTSCEKVLKFCRTSGIKKHKCYIEAGFKKRVKGKGDSNENRTIDGNEKVNNDDGKPKNPRIDEEKENDKTPLNTWPQFNNYEMEIVRKNIEQKLGTNVYKLQNNLNSKSPLWSILSLISMSDGRVMKGFVSCRQCNALVSYNGYNEDTLKQHECCSKMQFSEDAESCNLLELENDFEMDIIRKNVQQKISTGIYKLKDNPNATNPIWSNFSLIAIADGSTLNGFVSCKLCEMLLQYDGRSETSLTKHKCKINSPLLMRLDKDEDEIGERNSSSVQENGAILDDCLNGNSENNDLSDMDECSVGEVQEFVNDRISNSYEEVKRTTTSNDTALENIEENDELSECTSNRPFEIKEVKSLVAVSLPTINIVNESQVTSINAVRKSVYETDDNVKESVEQNIRNGVYKLKLKTDAEKNSIWNTFAMVHKIDGSLLEKWAYCRRCNKLEDNNTANLNNHPCYIATLKKLSVNAKEEDVDVYANWIIEDCNPISSIEGSGFQKMAKHFMKIGAKYGKHVCIDDFLPDYNSLTQCLKQKAEEKFLEIKSNIKEIPANAAVSLDWWHDNILHRNFLCATLHYSQNFDIRDNVLGVKSIDFKQTKPEIVRKKIEKLLSNFGLDNFQNLTFVFERNINIANALENCTAILYCSKSLFGNVLDKTIDETTELSEIIATCKRIAKHFKSSYAEITLKPSSISPCHSHYTLLKSISENWSQVKNICTKNLSLSDETITSLQNLVGYCKKFELIFKRLQETRQPSLCFVIPSIQRLKVMCELKANDSSEIIALKSNLSQSLDEIWSPHINIWHKTAFFLYPPAKQEQQNDLVQIKEFCISQMKALKANQTNEELLSTTATANGDNEIELEEDDDDMDFFFPNLTKRSAITPTTTNLEEDEIQRYCQENVIIDANFDVLKWWENHSSNYTLLSQVAKQILSIPASSRGMERQLGLAKNIMNENRNGLVAKSVDSILFLNALNRNNV